MKRLSLNNVNIERRESNDRKHNKWANKQCYTFFIGVVFRNYLSIWLYIKSIIYWNKEIRFSIAYLYKIKINNKYLLVKGRKIDQFQPIGGVYKVYESFKGIERKLNINFENEQGFYEDGDLRFYTKGKNIKKVLDWFKSRKNRETTVYREFYEEIIKNNAILPMESLIDIKIEYIKQVKPKLTYSKHFKKNEILVFDIYEIWLPDGYINKLCEYEKEESNLIKFVDREDIEKECVDVNRKSFKIGAHSKYII